MKKPKKINSSLLWYEDGKGGYINPESYNIAIEKMEAYVKEALPDEEELYKFFNDIDSSNPGNEYFAEKLSKRLKEI